MKKICLGCGKEFCSNYSQAKFCSKQCKKTPCLVCGKLIENPRRDRKTCSNRCKGVYQKQYYTGENNPNYGNTWSAEKKEKQSKIVKSKVDENYRLKAGSANRGKQFSKERIEKMHGHRNPESYGVSGKGHSYETKKKISLKSKEKFTSEYKKNFRNLMESRGNWVPLNKKTDYQIYFNECNWVANMFDIIDNGISMIQEHGVFNNKNNTKGVVRDHIIGRKYGYKFGVFPEIIRHPANCRIIKHSENVSKGQKGKGRPDADLTLEELFGKILSYDKEWKEQKICLFKIKEYNNGKRWERKEVKCVSESE